MTFKEVVLLTLHASKGFIVPLAVTIGVTAIALIALRASAKGTWINKPMFNAVALFFEIGAWSRIRLASSWVKLWLALSYFTIIDKLSAGHYALFAIPCILFALEFRKPIRIPLNLLSSAAPAAGLLITNVLRSYIRDMDLGLIAQIACVVLMILVAVYALYLFLTELNNISQERRVRLEKI